MIDSTALLKRLAALGFSLASLGFLAAAENNAPGPTLVPTQRNFDIRDYRAAADDPGLYTGAINRAMEACANSGGGQVLIPPGRYISGTIHLRSHVTLFLDAGATLVGTTNLALYEAPAVPSFMPEAKWGN